MIDLILSLAASIVMEDGGANWKELSIPLVIKDLPAWHLRSLNSLSVVTDGKGTRGLSNSSFIKIDTRQLDTPKELAYITIHEAGHVADLGALRGSAGKLTNFYDDNKPILSDDPSYKFYLYSWSDSYTQNKGVTAKDFVSGYAMSNAFEDFAEAYAMYRTRGDLFRCLKKDSLVLQRKYYYMYIFFGKKQFQIDTDIKNCSQVYDPSITF